MHRQPYLFRVQLPANPFKHHNRKRNLRKVALQADLVGTGQREDAPKQFADPHVLE